MKVIKREGCFSRYDERYVIVNDEGKIIDDANGYGYKSKQKAYRAMSYKYKGGKEKKEAKEAERKKFFREHPGVEEAINNLFEWNFKEIARGETTEEDIKKEIDEKFRIDLPIEYLRD